MSSLGRPFSRLNRLRKNKAIGLGLSASKTDQQKQIFLNSLFYTYYFFRSSCNILVMFYMMFLFVPRSLAIKWVDPKQRRPKWTKWRNAAKKGFSWLGRTKSWQGLLPGTWNFYLKKDLCWLGRSASDSRSGNPYKFYEWPFVYG